MRRAKVAKLRNSFQHGEQARLARLLGVSRSTICRDIAKNEQAAYGYRIGYTTGQGRKLKNRI